MPFRSCLPHDNVTWSFKVRRSSFSANQSFSWDLYDKKFYIQPFSIYLWLWFDTFSVNLNLSLIYFFLRNLGLESSFHTILFSYFLYPVNAISMMGSIYMTMVVGLERFVESKEECIKLEFLELERCQIILVGILAALFC